MLVDELMAIQKRMNVRDKEFAPMLGITRSMWCYARNGKKSLGLEPLACAFRLFPETRDLIIDSFLACKVTELTKRRVR